LHVFPSLYVPYALQWFELERPVAVPQGAEVILVLIGSQQQQTVGPTAGEEHDFFYVCLSHVSICGTNLATPLDVSGEQQQQQQKTRCRMS
jgi:hypothetical protein